MKGFMNCLANVMERGGKDKLECNNGDYLTSHYKGLFAEILKQCDDTVLRANNINPDKLPNDLDIFSVRHDKKEFRIDAKIPNQRGRLIVEAAITAYGEGNVGIYGDGAVQLSRSGKDFHEVFKVVYTLMSYSQHVRKVTDIAELNNDVVLGKLKVTEKYTINEGYWEMYLKFNNGVDLKIHRHSDENYTVTYTQESVTINEVIKASKECVDRLDKLIDKRKSFKSY